MKDRQFIVLCILIIVGFVCIRFRIDTNKAQQNTNDRTGKCYDMITGEEEKCP